MIGSELETETARARPPRERRSLWHNRDFLLLWSGQIVSTTGSRVSALALALLVLALTGSPLQASFAAAADQLPVVLFSLPAGALVDRWNRKLTMLMCDSARLLAYLSVPLAYLLAHVSMPQLYLVALIDGTAVVLFDNAQAACLPHVVAERDLTRAVGLNASSAAAAELVGPSLGGAVITAARSTLSGAVLAYGLNAASYLASVVSLLFIRVSFQEQRTPAAAASLRAEIAEGLRYVWTHPTLRALTLLIIGPNLCYGPIYIVIVWLLQHSLHASPLQVGLILSLESVGSLAGGQLAGWGPLERLGRRACVVTALLVATSGLALLAAATSFGFVAVGVVLAFLGVPLFGATLAGYRFSLIPDRLLGRVSSVTRLTSYLASPLGAVLGGILLQTVGVRVELLLSVAVMLVTVAAASRLGFQAVAQTPRRA